VIFNPRTDRIRKMVVQSGPKQLNQWLNYTRTSREDYERVFGEPPGALVGIGIMADSDNTHSAMRAWYGPVRLTSQRSGELSAYYSCFHLFLQEIPRVGTLFALLR
jgi:hypothetical protein